VCACCRVFSAYIKEIDEKPGATEWGSRMPFANLMAEFTSAAGMCWLFGLIVISANYMTPYCLSAFIWPVITAMAYMICNCCSVPLDFFCSQHILIIKI